MTCTTFADQDWELLERTREVLHSLEPNARMILYGSRARGDALQPPDVELLLAAELCRLRHYAAMRPLN